jgi:hypothetical protein
MGPLGLYEILIALPILLIGSGGLLMALGVKLGKDLLLAGSILFVGVILVGLFFMFRHTTN